MRPMGLKKKKKNSFVAFSKKVFRERCRPVIRRESSKRWQRGRRRRSTKPDPGGGGRGGGRRRVGSESKWSGRTNFHAFFSPPLSLPLPPRKTPFCLCVRTGDGGERRGRWMLWCRCGDGETDSAPSLLFHSSFFSPMRTKMNNLVDLSLYSTFVLPPNFGSPSFSKWNSRESSQELKRVRAKKCTTVLYGIVNVMQCTRKVGGYIKWVAGCS